MTPGRHETTDMLFQPGSADRSRSGRSNGRGWLLLAIIALPTGVGVAAFNGAAGGALQLFMSMAAVAVGTARSVALIFFSAPERVPKGVRTPERMTMSRLAMSSGMETPRKVERGRRR